MPLLVTLNYYDLLFPLVARISPDTTQTTRETISFLAMYLVTFSICVYFCLWLCAEDLRVGKTVDTIAGGLLGALTGTICCGVLMLIWFSMPFSRLPNLEVADTDMFYKPQNIALEAATLVAVRVKGERTFSGERFMRDLRYGLPQVPTLGGGLYISSVPAGLKVFAEPGSGPPQVFLNKIKERLNNPDKDLPPSEQKNAAFERGHTPLLLHESSGAATVAVVMESVPSDLEAVSGGEPDRLFAFDGEIGYAKETIGDRTLYIKFYHVGKTGTAASEIALFQPRDKTKFAQIFENFWPAKACFRFNKDQIELQIREKGTSPEEAKRLTADNEWINQLQTCGKALFQGGDGKDYALELSAPTQPGRVFEVQPASNLNAMAGAQPPR